MENDEMEYYEDEAENNFDTYHDEEDDFDSGLEGAEDEFYDDDDMYMGPVDPTEYSYNSEHDYDYDSYSKSSIGKIDPNDRTYTVVVANAAGTDEEAIVFGANENPSQPAGVTVDITESSHNEVKEESKGSPFKILGMKMSVSDEAQFDKVLRLVKRTSNGSVTERKYQPRNGTSPQNFNPKLIDDNNFEVDISGQDSVRVLVKAGLTIVFTFTVKARGNMGNLLKGRNVAELSRTPRTTGIPQLDLLKTRRPKRGRGRKVRGRRSRGRKFLRRRRR